MRSIASRLSDGTEDPDEQTRDVLLGQVFPRRAHVIDTAALRTLLQRADAKVTGVARGGF